MILLEPSHIILASFGRIEVSYMDQVKTLTLYVVSKEAPSLFGHDWLHHIQLNWEAITVPRRMVIHNPYSWSEVFKIRPVPCISTNNSGYLLSWLFHYKRLPFGTAYAPLTSSSTATRLHLTVHFQHPTYLGTHSPALRQMLCCQDNPHSRLHCYGRDSVHRSPNSSTSVVSRSHSTRQLVPSALLWYLYWHTVSPNSKSMATSYTAYHTPRDTSVSEARHCSLHMAQHQFRCSPLDTLLCPMSMCEDTTPHTISTVILPRSQSLFPDSSCWPSWTAAIIKRFFLPSHLHWPFH